jgi:chorismate mutase
VTRIWLVVTVVLFAGCGVQPSGVTDGPDAPTGVAPGTTLYFVDAHRNLRAQPRRTGRLGTISEAMSLLLLGVEPGTSDLHTEIAPNAMTRVMVTTTPDVIELFVPLTIRDVTPLGIDQIVCTTLGVHVQGGGSRNMRVRVRFTLATPESDVRRTCPLIK